jgi:ABC-type polysaccharide/polyol phosphate transport system ATPase subunit
VNASASPVVRADGLSKAFRRAVRHDTLVDVIAALGRRRALAEPDLFWALRDVSFELHRGDTLGIIGPNGAGKSTILRLLTGILRPTEGTVTVHGRVGALIELAAGFHPDLTGRDNVFLQGAIMGMRRAEIGRRFDAIVEFAGVSSFVDTPVKHFSSGMQARLGFAIAAHLDPDVLFIDEVLAVGDYAFQRRAVAHVKDLVRGGVPVVFVSHQLELVSELCNQVLLLAGGRVVRRGTAEECVNAYVIGEAAPGAPLDQTAAPIRITGISANVDPHLQSGQHCHVDVRGCAAFAYDSDRVTIGVRVRALPSEETIFATHSGVCGITLPPREAFALAIDLQMNVGRGLYRLEAFVFDPVDERELARGPSTVVTVEREPSNYGRVSLNPVMRLTTPS